MAKISNLIPFLELTLVDGSQQERICTVDCPFTVAVKVAAGDTVNVWTRATQNADLVQWAPGPVTASTEQVRLSPCYSIAVQRTAGSGTTSKLCISQ